MNRETFEEHIRSTAKEGSDKASSYLKAIDYLKTMLAAHPLSFEDCQDVWAIDRVERLVDLRDQVRDQQAKGDQSVWNIPGIPPSYLQKGFCSAALTAYIEFLVEHRHSENVLGDFLQYDGPEGGVAEKLERELRFPEALLRNLKKKEGRDVMRQVKGRANQDAFRKIILHLYQGRCCVTGLDVPEVNRASHIIPWSEDQSKRLDPRNGLCLSATYDAAFDRHLLSLDDDYRIILSRDLKDHYTSETVRAYFHNREGEPITRPAAYLPLISYLERHRSKGRF
jgi:putative restriction endonuclease